MKRSLIFVALTSLIIYFTGCSKEEVLEFPIQSKAELLFFDSINANPNGIVYEPFEVINKSSMIRAEKTILFSRTLTLNMYTALDFYIPKENLEDNMQYTAVMTPLVGNPNLNLCSHLPGRIPPYRMIDDDFKDGVEQLSCTREVLLAEEVELNFLIKGKIGDSFHWEIYKEPLPPIDTNIVSPTCVCGEEDTEVLICENFEGYPDREPASSSPFFMPADNEASDGSIRILPNAGLDSDGFLFVKNQTTQSTSATLELGNLTAAAYKMTWSFRLEENGRATVQVPFAAARYTFTSTNRGTMNLFNYYNVGFIIPTDEWIEFELMFDLGRNLFRFQVGDIYYFWQTTPINLNDALKVIFEGTDLGYSVDNICFEKIS